MKTENIGIIEGNISERVTLRVCAVEPYSTELTGEQVGLLADISEKYGSGHVHVTARQTIEIPNIEKSRLNEVSSALNGVGLYTGSTDTYTRNVMGCSKWCLYNVLPVSELAQRLNVVLRTKNLPDKMDISLSGCAFSCTRSRTSDIGVIAKAEIALTDKPCINCFMCISAPLGCQVEAIDVTDGKVTIDMDRCVNCGFCTRVCKPETIVVTKTGFDIYLGGNGGRVPRVGVFYKRVKTENEVFSEIERLINRYIKVATKDERIADVINRAGIAIFNEGA
jgi:dissimilatory sulfite reductase (desulfoviridin) alpha/beta subunit